MKEEKKLHYHREEEVEKITPPMQEIIDATHNAFLTHNAFQGKSGTAFGIVLNQYVKVLCTNQKITMGEFATFLRERYHYKYAPSELKEILFGTSLHPYPRLRQDSDSFVNWSKKGAELLLQTFQGKQEAYNELSAYLETSAYKDKFFPGTQVRFLLLHCTANFHGLINIGILTSFQNMSLSFFSSDI